MFWEQRAFQLKWALCVRSWVWSQGNSRVVGSLFNIHHALGVTFNIYSHKIILAEWCVCVVYGLDFRQTFPVHLRLALTSEFPSLSLLSDGITGMLYQTWIQTDF